MTLSYSTTTSLFIASSAWSQRAFHRSVLALKALIQKLGLVSERLSSRIMHRSPDILTTSKDWWTYIHSFNSDTNIDAIDSIREKGSEVLCPTRHISSHFIDKSLHVIEFTGDDNKAETNRSADAPKTTKSQQLPETNSQKNKVSSVMGRDDSWPNTVPSVVPSLRYSLSKKATRKCPKWGNRTSSPIVNRQIQNREARIPIWVS